MFSSCRYGSKFVNGTTYIVTITINGKDAENVKLNPKPGGGEFVNVLPKNNLLKRLDAAAAAAAKSLQSCPILSTPWTAAYQAPPSRGFSRQECWSRVPLPSPDLMLKWLKNIWQWISESSLCSGAEICKHEAVWSSLPEILSAKSSFCIYMLLYIRPPGRIY